MNHDNNTRRKKLTYIFMVYLHGRWGKLLFRVIFQCYWSGNSFKLLNTSQEIMVDVCQGSGEIVQLYLRTSSNFQHIKGMTFQVLYHHSITKLFMLHNWHFLDGFNKQTVRTEKCRIFQERHYYQNTFKNG